MQTCGKHFIIIINKEKKTTHTVRCQELRLKKHHLDNLVKKKSEREITLNDSKAFTPGHSIKGV